MKYHDRGARRHSQPHHRLLRRRQRRQCNHYPIHRARLRVSFESLHPDRFQFAGKRQIPEPFATYFHRLAWMQLIQIRLVDLGHDMDPRDVGNGQQPLALPTLAPANNGSPAASRLPSPLPGTRITTPENGATTTPEASSASALSRAVALATSISASCRACPAAFPGVGEFRLCRGHRQGLHLFLLDQRIQLHAGTIPRS